MALPTGTFADWLKSQGYTMNPEGGYSYLDSEGLDASLTGANERLSDMQRLFENRDFWVGELAAVQSGTQLGEQKYTPKSANIPSYDQWLASGGQARGDNPPEYEYLSQFYNIPDYSKGDWMEQIASNLPILMSGVVLGQTALPALLGGAGSATAATTAETLAGFTETGAGLGSAADLMAGGTQAGTGGVADFAAEGVDLFGNGWDIFDAPTSPMQFADTTQTTAGPQTVMDVPPVGGPPLPEPVGLGTEFTETGAGLGSAADITAGVSGGTNATSLVDDLIKWGKNNQLLASTGLNLAGGLIKGAMAPTPEEQARAIADERLRIEEANRAATRIPAPRWPKPTGRMLRQPGQLPPGLINRAMR